MSIVVSKENKQKSPNQYLLEVIEQKRSIPISISDGRVQSLCKHLEEWAGRDLSSIFISGSSAKGTSLKGSSDIDLFISLKASMSDKLKENFNSLVVFLKSKGIVVRPQNVSVRVIYHNLQIDIVPGKKKPRQVHRHYLYTNRREDQNRIETNVNKHVKFILGSNRINEIIALKIWREINNLDFPSMYLEMYVIKALSGKWTSKKFLARNFLHVLEDLSRYIHSTAIYDPANRNNVISSNFYKYELDPIQKAAEASLKQEYLSDIIYNYK